MLHERSRAVPQQHPYEFVSYYNKTCLLRNELNSYLASLSRYFLENKFKEEINRTNPLGMKARPPLKTSTYTPWEMSLAIRAKSQRASLRY